MVALRTILALLALSPVAGAVTLAWDASTDATVVGYKLHFGAASGKWTIHVDIGNVTTARTTIPPLTAGATYFAVVTAYNAAGVESLPSNEVSFTLPSDSPPGQGTVITVLLEKR